MRKAFNVVEAGAADDADAIIRHGGFIALARPKVANVFRDWRSCGNQIGCAYGTVL
jgi:hypothetical protein